MNDLAARSTVINLLSVCTVVKLVSLFLKQLGSMGGPVQSYEPDHITLTKRPTRCVL